MSEVKLLPCPFCGGEASAENYVIEAQASCLSCKAKIVRSHDVPDDSGLPEAVAAWNTRANMEPLIAENERLRAEAAKRDGIDPWAVLLRAQEAAARAERLAEALSLLPDEIDMIEHNPDEGLHTFCCGREVKSRGLHGFLITHDEDCWYLHMNALRDHDQEGGNG